MQYKKCFSYALCGMLIIGLTGNNLGISVIYASEIQYFDTAVENGLLYSNEDGKIIDKDGNIIPEYGEYEVNQQGYILAYGEVLRHYRVGAGGKIISSDQQAIDYSYESEEQGTENTDSYEQNSITSEIGDSDNFISEDNGYYSLYDIINLGVCESNVGKKVYYEGILIDNTDDTFTISGGGVRMPYVIAQYDARILDNAPSNQILSENPVYVTVWGVLTGEGQMELEHICMGGSAVEKETAKLVDVNYFRGDWPDNIGETVKCIGVFRNDGRWEALERPREDILAEFCKANEHYIQELYTSSSNSISLSINIDVYDLPIYGYNSLNSFADTPVAVYGSMAGTGAMSFDYIEPLAPEEWTYDIESMMEDTGYILTEKDEYIREHLAELW